MTNNTASETEKTTEYTTEASENSTEYTMTTTSDSSTDYTVDTAGWELQDYLEYFKSNPIRQEQCAQVVKSMPQELIPTLIYFLASAYEEESAYCGRAEYLLSLGKQFCYAKTAQEEEQLLSRIVDVNTETPWGDRCDYNPSAILVLADKLGYTLVDVGYPYRFAQKKTTRTARWYKKHPDYDPKRYNLDFYID